MPYRNNMRPEDVKTSKIRFLWMPFFRLLKVLGFLPFLAIGATWPVWSWFLTGKSSDCPLDLGDYMNLLEEKKPDPDAPPIMTRADLDDDEDEDEDSDYNFDEYDDV